MRDCGRRCVYCGHRLDPLEATLDHVHPVARGGAHAPGNLVVACAPCNRMKGDMLPYEFFGGIRLRAPISFVMHGRCTAPSNAARARA